MIKYVIIGLFGAAMLLIGYRLGKAKMRHLLDMAEELANGADKVMSDVLDLIKDYEQQE